MKKSIVAFLALVSTLTTVNVAQASWGAGPCPISYEDTTHPNYVPSSMLNFCCDSGYALGFRANTIPGGHVNCDEANPNSDAACVAQRRKLRFQCSTSELYPALLEGWRDGLRAGWSSQPNL